jgi:hypothetical protein
VIYCVQLACQQHRKSYRAFAYYQSIFSLLS